MRHAYICTAKQCQPPVRLFVTEDRKPECPEHGNTMKRQENVPYRAGKGTGEPKRVKPKRPKAEAKK